MEMRLRGNLRRLYANAGHNYAKLKICEAFEHLIYTVEYRTGCRMQERDRILAIKHHKGVAIRYLRTALECLQNRK